MIETRHHSQAVLAAAPLAGRDGARSPTSVLTGGYGGAASTLPLLAGRGEKDGGGDDGKGKSIKDATEVAVAGADVYATSLGDQRWKFRDHPLPDQVRAARIQMKEVYLFGVSGLTLFTLSHHTLLLRLWPHPPLALCFFSLETSEHARRPLSTCSTSSRHVAPQLWGSSDSHVPTSVLFHQSPKCRPCGGVGASRW